MTTRSNEAAPPAYEVSPLSHREILVVFSALMLGMLLAALDQTVLATALPTIVGELGGLEHLSWVLTSYLLASTTSVPLYGKLGDLYGRKIMFQTAIALFIVGSLASGVSQDMTQIIGARAIQGVGAGGLMATSQAIIADILSPRERGRYIGYLVAVFAFSSVAGPLIGGFFTDGPGWRWVFFINLPLGLLAFVVTSKVLHLPKVRIEHRIDYLGAALLVAGVSAILLATTWGGSEYAWGSAQIVGLAVGGIALLVLFVWQETRVAEPILPLSLFADRTFRVSSALLLLLGMALFGAIAFVPVFLQVVDGVSATSSGLRTTPMTIGITGMSVGSGMLISITGRYRIYPIVGTALASFGLFLLSTLTADTSIWLLSVFLLLLGMGIGLVMQTTTLAVQNSVNFRDMGAATAGITFFRTMGGALGVAMFGTILTNKLETNLPKYVPAEALRNLDTAALTASPEQLRSLPPEVLEGVRQAFAHSLDVVFLLAVPLAAVSFLLSWFLPHLTLKERTKPSPTASDSEAGEVAAEQPVAVLEI